MDRVLIVVAMLCLIVTGVAYLYGALAILRDHGEGAGTVAILAPFVLAIILFELRDR